MAMQTVKPKEVTVQFWHLVQDSKMYRIWLTGDGYVALNWGKNRSGGQTTRTKYKSYEDAETVALKKVYDKKAKGYEPISLGNLIYHAEEPDASILLDNVSLPGMYTDDFQSDWALNSATSRSLRNYRDVPVESHEQVFDVVEKFTDEVNEFLSRNKRQNKGIVEEFARLRSLWADLQEKFEDAETAMEMAEARAAMTLERV